MGVGECGGVGVCTCVGGWVIVHMYVGVLVKLPAVCVFLTFCAVSQ